MQCGVGFSDQHQLTYHAVLQHSSETVTIKNPLSLLTHSKTGRDDTGATIWQCSLCGYKALRILSIVGHLAALHSSGQDISCRLCDETFNDVTKAAYHVESVHNGDPVQFLKSCELED